MSSRVGYTNLLHHFHWDTKYLNYPCFMKKSVLSPKTASLFQLSVYVSTNPPNVNTETCYHLILTTILYIINSLVSFLTCIFILPDSHRSENYLWKVQIYCQYFSSFVLSIESIILNIAQHFLLCSYSPTTIRPFFFFFSLANFLVLDIQTLSSPWILILQVPTFYPLSSMS